MYVCVPIRHSSPSASTEKWYGTSTYRYYVHHNIGDKNKKRKTYFITSTKAVLFTELTIRGYRSVQSDRSRIAASYLCSCIYSSAWVPLIWKKSKISIFERFAFASKTADSDIPQHSRDRSVWHISYSTLQITDFFSKNVGCSWHVPKMNWWGHHLFDNRGVTDGRIDYALKISM